MRHCSNCGGHFTDREIEHRKPPRYPWKLGPVGARVAAANALVYNTTQCPECGNATLDQAPAATT